MKYEELSYRRMLQIVQSSRTARFAVVQDGAPYVVPVCVRCRMDGCIPVFEVRAGNDGDLLAALASNCAVMLEFETPGHAGAMETVLVRGRAAVEQTVTPCGCGDHCRLEDRPGHRADRRQEPGVWEQHGRVRFEARDGWTAENYGAGRCTADRFSPDARYGEGESCACTRRESCSACSCRENRSGTRPESCSCGCRRQSGHTPAAVITVTADEMTGRCYAACVARCRSGMDWEG